MHQIKHNAPNHWLGGIRGAEEITDAVGCAGGVSHPSLNQPPTVAELRLLLAIIDVIEARAAQRPRRRHLQVVR